MQLVCELKRMLRRIQNSRAIVFIELDTDDVKIVRKSRKKRDRIECRYNDIIVYTTQYIQRLKRRNRVQKKEAAQSLNIYGKLKPDTTEIEKKSLPSSRLLYHCSSVYMLEKGDQSCLSAFNNQKLSMNILKKVKIAAVYSAGLRYIL